MTNDKSKAEMDAYLARIRKTIADSQNLVSQAELAQSLRIASENLE